MSSKFLGLAHEIPMTPEASELVKLIPNLRRYARLLTGHSLFGDVLVMSTLKRLAGEAKEDERRKDVREHFYLTLTRIWRSPINDHLQLLAGATKDIEEQDCRLGAMVPIARAAFVLVWVEGFSHRVAARILDASIPELEDMLREANIAISRQLATDVLIIEDELLIAFQLEDLMAQLGHHVTSVVRTHRLAVKHSKLFPPKLILADINLADGTSGIEAVNEILEGVSAPVIFITAYPERLLTGVRPEPAFVISKPFKTEEIQAVVGQALFFDLKARYGTIPEMLASQLVGGNHHECLAD